MSLRKRFAQLGCRRSAGGHDGHQFVGRGSGGLSRREVLAGLSAVGLSGMLPAPLAFQPARSQERARTLIDFHLHFGGAAAAQPPGPSNAPGGRRATSAQQVLEMMDEGGVAIGLLSQPGGAAVDNPATAAKACREINESMAKTVADRPARFGIFANLPLPDIDASLKELDYAMGTRKANGVHLLTSYQSTTFLGDPKFDPLFEELNRRRIVVKTHPAGNACCQALPANTGFDAGLVELGTDTMRAIGRMVFSGAAEKFKAVPYDIAQAYHPVTLQALKTLVPMSQVLFGTDYAFRTALQTIEGIEKGGIFNAQELRAVGDGNGRKLLVLGA